MKTRVCLFFVLVALSSWAQEAFTVRTPTFAYADKNATQKAGIYLRGAYLANSKKINATTYEIGVDYSAPIYIKDSQHLKKTLHVDDVYAPSPAPIIDEDQYYGSAHLFTTVAGLKVREYPNTSSSTLGTVLNGTVIPLTYYPLAQDGWVAFNFNDRVGYVSVQFLGQRPVLSELMQAYNKAIEPTDKKKYAERILELGWNSNKLENTKALEFFSEYAKQNNLTDLATLTQLQAKALQSAPKDGDDKKVRKLKTTSQFGFTLNGMVEPEPGFSKNTIEKYVGFPIDSYSDLDDCTLDDYEGVAFYNTAEFITHDVNHTLIVRKLDMLNANGFKIGNSQLNENTTEIEFLNAAMGLISILTPNEKSYGILYQDGYYNFKFINNKLYKVELIYYC